MSVSSPVRDLLTFHAEVRTMGPWSGRLSSLVGADLSRDAFLARNRTPFLVQLASERARTPEGERFETVVTRGAGTSGASVPVCAYALRKRQHERHLGGGRPHRAARPCPLRAGASITLANEVRLLLLGPEQVYAELERRRSLVRT